MLLKLSKDVNNNKISTISTRKNQKYQECLSSKMCKGHVLTTCTMNYSETNHIYQ